MLAQSSDWTFIMKTGTTVPYATRRINEHILQFTRLYDDLRASKLSEPFLSDLETRNNLFPHMDYRIYAS
jgi:1,4-alpha-glucan branching enzyme